MGMPCIGGSTLEFSCPPINIDPYRLPDVVGEYFVFCSVCGIGPQPLHDVDPRGGRYMGDLYFGPNFRDGAVNEDGITGYSIFVATAEGARVANFTPVHFVQRRELFASPGMTVFTSSAEVPRRCCEDNAYVARLVFELPPGLHRLRFEVVPHTVDGPLPVGRLSSVVEDNFDGLFSTSAAAGRPGRFAGARDFLSLVLALVLPASLRGRWKAI